MRLSLDLGLGSIASLNAGGLVPPSGFVFLTEAINGRTYYLTDSDGYYLVEPV